jgi:hypothetical protein
VVKNCSSFKVLKKKGGGGGEAAMLRAFKCNSVSCQDVEKIVNQWIEFFMTKSAYEVNNSNKRF